MEKLYSRGRLISSPDPLLPLRDGILVPVTVDLEGERKGSIVGYKAKKNANKIDISHLDYYDPRDFWYKIESSDGRLNLDEGDFYILATREDVGVPPQTAAEWFPMTHAPANSECTMLAFFDPGFG